MGHRITQMIFVVIFTFKTPVVLAGSIDPDEQVGSVNIDYTATKDATATLAKMETKIAFVSGALIDQLMVKTNERLQKL